MVKQNVLGARHGEEKLHNSWQTGGKNSGGGVGEWKQDKHSRVHPQLRPTSQSSVQHSHDATIPQEHSEHMGGGWGEHI